MDCIKNWHDDIDGSGDIANIASIATANIHCSLIIIHSPNRYIFLVIFNDSLTILGSVHYATAEY